MNYVIAWKSKLTGDGGQGTATFPKKVAEDACRDLDERHPDIKHWAQHSDPFIGSFERLARGKHTSL